LQDALVAVVTEGDGAEAAGCSGLAVANTATGTLILTAAHCTFRSGQPARLFVVPNARASFDASAARSPVVRRWVHPRFSLTRASTAYDVALLELDRVLGIEAFPVLLPDTGALATGARATTHRTHARGGARWEGATVRSATALTLTLQTEGSDVCQGASGAAIAVGADDDVRIAGILSRGPAACGPGVRYAARASAALPLLAAARAGDVAPNASDIACGECIDTMSEQQDVCLSVVTGCRTERECARMLECLESCATVACSAACSANVVVSERTSALCRCATSQGCRNECRAACAPRH